MEQFAEFVTNHMVLSVLFVVILTLLIKNLSAEVVQGASSVDPSEATRLLNRENAIVVDIRSPDEFSEGHILNAKNIPYSEFETRTAELEKLRDRPMIICCKTGTSTNVAIANLKKMGFENLHRLKGGIDNWKHESLPLTT
ncbi:MAG: rhodanese-like domain-containing protein [Gammaproteobacteria bacterium]